VALAKQAAQEHWDHLTFLARLVAGEATLRRVGISAHRDHSFRFIVTARFGRT
jgi:3-methyladenine DNA glycosylase Mpg